MKSPLIFVGDRCNDHSPSSGYDQLCSLFPDAGWLSAPGLAEQGLTWHRQPNSGEPEPRSLFHVFYGDCSGRAAPAILRVRYPDSVIACTVHQPISRLERDRAALSALGHADALITVAAEQAEQLAALKLNRPVYTLPHGVWTRAFRPAHSARRATGTERQVLLVGNYLRDWEGAARITDRLAASGVRSLVVGSQASGEPFRANASVALAARLAENQLAGAYQRSAALLMPVLDATASNALLEAMAAGCPIVCTRSAALVDEYLGDRSDSFEPGDWDTAVSRLLHYVRDPSARAMKSTALLSRAQRFDWSNLSSQYARCYNEILTRCAEPDSPTASEDELLQHVGDAVE